MKFLRSPLPAEALAKAGFDTFGTFGTFAPYEENIDC